MCIPRCDAIAQLHVYIRFSGSNALYRLKKPCHEEKCALIFASPVFGA